MDLLEAELPVSGSGSISPAVFEPQVMELSLHLPSWQVAALEDLAHQRGLSIGQLLRRLIANLVEEQTGK